MSDDAEAQKLMANWDAEHPEKEGSISSDEGGDDDEPLSYDDMLEQFRRDVNPGDNELDHIVLGVSNLDKAIDDFEKLTGIRPVMVVSLNGVGTKSARVAFNEPIFLEIIGPDEKQGLKHMGEKLSKIPEGEFVPIHYGVRSKQLPERKQAWKELGLGCDMVTMVAKDRGMPWKWDMWIVQDHEEGGLIPYFCDWKDQHHASGRLPIMGDFGSITVRAPADSPLHKLMADVKNVNVESGPENFDFEFKTSTGTHSFTSTAPMGIVFPQ